MRRFTSFVLVLASAILAPALASAQQPTGIQPGIRTSLEQVRFIDTRRAQSRRSSQAPQTPSSQATVANCAQKTKAAIGLGFLGMLAGGWLGATLEGNCGCDDPGLAGGMIGAPTGAVVGAILGWHLGQ